MITALSIILFAALILGCLRLLLGPSRADRAIVFDLLTAILIAVTVIIAIALDDVRAMSLVIVLSILSFIGTSLFAYHIEKTKETE
ncbi:MAG: hypothetical protein OM95_00595 [Bdellovibrio sp. ArHS]|nr:MAG: hypothetical protein OM95_00595 [Bdellovibrio sp. ArHS]